MKYAVGDRVLYLGRPGVVVRTLIAEPSTFVQFDGSSGWFDSSELMLAPHDLTDDADYYAAITGGRP